MVFLKNREELKYSLSPNDFCNGEDKECEELRIKIISRLNEIAQ
jgi:hypothetical protein